MAINKVWEEKYRPKTLGKIIMPSERTKQLLHKIVESGELPNLLLHGGPGTGKSSTSQALLKDLGIPKEDVLRINCSDEKIEALRDKVKGFASTMPTGRINVVQLEELDYLGHDAFALLRSLIEAVSQSCRFIATCNYITKVPPPIRSRFQELEFVAPDRDQLLVLAAEVLEAEGVEAEIEDLERVVAATFPDARKLIQSLQAGTLNGRFELTTEASAGDWKLQLLPLLASGDLKAARKLICATATQGELVDVYKFLFDNIDKIKPLSKRQDQAVVLLAQYQFQHAFVADGELNLAACFIELEALK